MAIAYGSRESVSPASRAPAISLFSDEARQVILTTSKPSYYTAVGLVATKLVRFKRLNNGLLGAVYETRIRNPHSGVMEVNQYLWGVDKNGRPIELKRFPPKVF